MRPVVSSFVLALLPALLPAQDFGAKSLQDLYPLPVEGKKWVRSELPFAAGDYSGQPRLILIVPKKSDGGEEIGEMVSELQSSFGDQGLVIYAATDEKSSDEKLAALGLADIPVLTSASKVVRSYKAKKQAVAYLQGNNDQVIWEGNIPRDGGPSADLIKRIRSEVEGCHPAPELRELHEKLAGLAELVQRKRFVEAAKQMEKLRKKKELRDDLAHVSEQLDAYRDRLTDELRAAMEEKRPLDVAELTRLYMIGYDAFSNDTLAAYSNMVAKWMVDPELKKIRSAAIGYANAEYEVRNGKPKQALVEFRALAGSSGNDDVDRAAYRRIAVLEKALGKKR